MSYRYPNMPLIPTPTGRFAPSPSGDLHVGNLRTALAAWLWARHEGGRFLVRIDDLDPDRSSVAIADRQLRDLQLLGIDWDERPIRQSDRRHLYAAAIEQLRSDSLLYPCFCSRADIRAAATAPHGSGQTGAYPGTCSTLSEAERSQRITAGDGHCWRVRTDGVTVEFEDALLGPVNMRLDDFVVVRRDGVAAYNVAVVVDDNDQKVTRVVRGADLAPTTPRQIWVYRKLNLRPPEYAHVPLVVGEDGTRLAKRHGSITIEDWISSGQSLESLRAELIASLGITEFTVQDSLADAVSMYDPKQFPQQPLTWQGQRKQGST